MALTHFEIAEHRAAKATAWIRRLTLPGLRLDSSDLQDVAGDRGASRAMLKGIQRRDDAALGWV
jgi:HD superfamily phosphodiesterase